MNRRRPGRLWFFFYGRRRRGFPGLLVVLIALVVVLGSLFRLPLGADISRTAMALSISALALVILAAIVLVAIAAIRPRKTGPVRRSGRTRGRR